MKENGKPSAGPGDKSAPPLRSTTDLRSSAANRASPGVSSSFAVTAASSGVGLDSIRLNTYHDSSDLKAALRELEAAFATPGAATTSTHASSLETKGVAHTGDRNSRAMNTTPKTSISPSPVSPNVTVIVEPRAAASVSSPPPPPSRTSASAPSAPSAFIQLPPQLLLRCFAFCDLKTLGVLSSVSVRLNVIVEQQGSSLWAAAALRRRVPVANAAAARLELRRALEQRARARHAEEEFYETEIARMEERLRARAEDVYAQNVDVERIIASGGDSCGGGAPPYWLRRQRTGEPGLADRGSGTSGNAATIADKNSISAQLVTRLRAEVETLEEVKRLCECKMSLQEASLSQQEAQLQRWQALLSPGEATTRATSSVNGPSEKDASSPLITAAQLEQFERRVTRLVLSGARTTTSAAAADEDERADIPVVFRRGVEDFAGLELVLHALNAHAGVEGAPSSAEDAPGSRAFPSAAARDAGKRWRAFQQVCPVNEEYENARFYLKSQELRATLPSAAGAPQSSGDSGARPSAKQTPALLRLSGFVRRVAAMTDSQVVQSWM